MITEVTMRACHCTTVGYDIDVNPRDPWKNMRTSWAIEAHKNKALQFGGRINAFSDE